MAHRAWGRAPEVSAVPNRSVTAAGGPDTALQTEVRVLRDEVAGLRGMLGALAAADRQAAVAPSGAPPPTPTPNRGVLPAGAGATPDEIIDDFATGTLDAGKTRTVAATLQTRLSRESLAAAQAKVEEVDCRGSTCRLRVSLAEDAPNEDVLLELAALFPDSQGFQEFAPVGNHRRIITSHQVERTPKPPSAR